MGKEWYWSGKSSKRTTSSSNGQVLVVDRDSDNRNRNSSTTSTGCMCAVFQLFDFPQLHFAPNIHHNHDNETSTTSLFKPITRNNTHSSTTNATFQLPEEEPNLPKGTEAPRNSLNKSEEENSLSSIIEDEELVESFHNIQMGMNQIKTITTTPSSKSADFSSDTTSCSSPVATGAKTPSLVARLMGLDLLPETNSPTHNNNNTTINKLHQNHTKKPHHHYYNYTHSSLRQNVREPSGTRSLPETPRPSASRRSDVDANHLHHHRLSLQLNKENNNNNNNNSLVFSQDLDLSSRLCSSLRRSYYQNDEEEACYYARKAVRQAKESVVAARKAACLSDITNNTREPKRSWTSSSSSPRLKPCVVREQEVKRDKASGKMKEETFVFGPMMKKTMKKKKKTKKSRDYGESTKSGNNSYKRANINIPHSKIIKRKRIASHTSSSKDLLSGLKNVVVKKTSSSNTNSNNGDYDQLKVPHKSQSRRAEVITQMSTSHLSSCQSQRSRHVSGKNDAVRHYITKILGRTGISAASHVSFTNWFSPSHPLDPSIFRRLELHYSNNIYLKNSHQHLLSPTSNRKLVFDVVDQLLVEILRPCINLKPWTIMNNNSNKNLSFYCNVDDQVPRINNNAMRGKDLIETLCTRVEGFPCKDCQVLEDIDALIDQDLCDHHIVKAQNEIAFEEESEALVMEIEKDIVDTLVHETALFFMGKIPS